MGKGLGIALAVCGGGGNNTIAALVLLLFVPRGLFGRDLLAPVPFPLLAARVIAVVISHRRQVSPGRALFTAGAGGLFPALWLGLALASLFFGSGCLE